MSAQLLTMERITPDHGTFRQIRSNTFMALKSK